MHKIIFRNKVLDYLAENEKHWRAYRRIIAIFVSPVTVSLYHLFSLFAATVGFSRSVARLTTVKPIFISRFSLTLHLLFPSFSRALRNSISAIFTTDGCIVKILSGKKLPAYNISYNQLFNYSCNYLKKNSEKISSRKDDSLIDKLSVFIIFYFGLSYIISFH